MADPVVDDERTRASDTLGRLVRFLASALDVRYAFVAAPRVGDGVGTRVALWLARDYGLRTESSVVALPEGLPEASPYVESALRLAVPLELERPDLAPGRIVSVELFGTGRRSIGRLGILDPGGRRALCEEARLLPIARRAAAELERWVSSNG